MEQNRPLLTSLLAALTVLSLAVGIYYWRTNGELIRENDVNEQRADSLLSAKFRLEGDVRSLDRQLETATGENASLEKRIATLHTQLNASDRKLSDFRQQTTAHTTRFIRQLQQTIGSLTTRRDSLENQMEAIQDKINWLTDANNLLLGQNKALQQQLNTLNSTLLTSVSRSAVTGDAFMAQVTKSNRKETAKAKKAATLAISLNIPSELQREGVHDVYLSLTDAHQNPLFVPLRETTVSLADVNEVIPIHAVQRIDFGRTPQRISFSVMPPHSLEPGNYRASVFTKDAYLGSVMFQLRDSFLFF